MQALAFLAVFVYAMKVIAFEWKPGLKLAAGKPSTVGQRAGTSVQKSHRHRELIDGKDHHGAMQT